MTRKTDLEHWERSKVEMISLKNRVIYRKYLPKLKNRDAMFDVWLHQLVAYKEAIKLNTTILDFETDSEIYDWQ